MLRCSFCGRDLAYVHGHAACICPECPLRGLSQADCCAGEGMASCTAHVVPRTPMADPRTSGIWAITRDTGGTPVPIEDAEPAPAPYAFARPR